MLKIQTNVLNGRMYLCPGWAYRNMARKTLIRIWLTDRKLVYGYAWIRVNDDDFTHRRLKRVNLEKVSGRYSSKFCSRIRQLRPAIENRTQSNYDAYKPVCTYVRTPMYSIPMHGDCSTAISLIYSNCHASFTQPRLYLYALFILPRSIFLFVDS